MNAVRNMSRSHSPASRAPPASIATVERETGLSKDTLRVWERRYGFPDPQRDRRGERVYPPEQIEKLRVISRLLDRGMRPGQVMKLPLPTLIERFQASEPVPEAGASEVPGGALAPMMREAIERLKACDEPGLRAHLSRVLLRLGLQRFVIELAAPLNELVGEAILSLHWMNGAHEVSDSLPFLYFLGGGLTIVCYLIGRRILAGRYRRYLQEPVSFLGFSSERDRRIAHRQKAVAILAFGVAMPGIAAVIAFWGWVLAHL